MAYARHHKIPDDGPAVTAPAKAWNGISIDTKYANKVAEFLGVDNYLALEHVGSHSKWTDLLQKEQYRDVLFDWGFEDDDEWRNTDFSLLDQEEESEILESINAVVPSLVPILAKLFIQINRCYSLVNKTA